MILHNLCKYYDRIAADPTQEIAQEGFAPQKISFEIVIRADGSLHSLQDIRDTSGQKPTPRTMRLPYCGKRSSGIKAMFLWDKAEYLLGWLSADLRSIPEPATTTNSKRLKDIKRVEDCFTACKTFHSSLEDLVAQTEFQSLLSFFESWTASKLTSPQNEFLDNIGTGFGVFRIQGKKEYIHDNPSICEFWQHSQQQPNTLDNTGPCLVTGKVSPLAQLHPVVKGVNGAQSSGASIVSFNDHAFISYGKKQSFNAPVSKTATFKYTTALNHLLAKDTGRKIQIGDTSCVYWADEASECEDLFGFGLAASNSEDDARASEIGNTLKRIASGESVPPGTGVAFHILGLSPNASRLSIRFWISEPADALIRRVAQHQQRLEIVKGPNDREFLPLWLVLSQTARESKDIQPLLSGALLRSILTDGRYPDSLFAAILRRIRVERDIRHPKAAIIKAILIRNYQKEISIMLDENRKETSYQLGRLFASLERVQEDALPGLNATIKDRYFGAASSTPSTVFPRLIRLSQHHVRKLIGGKKVVAEKRIQEIVGRINSFPQHFGLADQGLFSIGYYHQRQDFFTKKTDDNA